MTTIPFSMSPSLEAAMAICRASADSSQDRKCRISSVSSKASAVVPSLHPVPTNYARL